MNHFQHIQEKLQEFIKKYYTNEIIKGSIFFVTFGLLYFFLTLLIEHFLWLEPVYRTVLFWLFIFIETTFLFRFILIPLFKLFGIRKRISETEASAIIGRHFSEVDDKLTNILQLKSSDHTSDLLEASIEQKSEELTPISFKKAVVFEKNATYLKYILIPVFVWFVFWITGNNSIFTQSLNRVVHHQTAFEAPAPFYFEILNQDLTTIQDKSYTLRFRTVGEIVPETIQIIYDNNGFYISQDDEGIMTYTFDFPEGDIEFFLEGNSVRSRPYTLNVMAAPKITDFSMELEFPAYLGKPNDTIRNTGNAVLPKGTQVTWFVASEHTESLDFREGSSGESTSLKTAQMTEEDKGYFSLKKTIRKNMNYEISSSNKNLKDFETLRYNLEVVEDEYPKIFVQSDIDSVNRGPVRFKGQLTDDYGITRLQVVAKNKGSGKQSIGQIQTERSDFEEFFYVFPEGILLEEGASYEIYFEVFDNDGISGPKKTVSQMFNYRNKTQQEEESEILEEQRQGIEEMEDSRDSGKSLEKELDEFSKKLKNKQEADWNDKKELDEFLERQKRYQEMMDKNADMMQKNLDEMDSQGEPELHEKKEELKKRWEEMSDYKDKKELLEELEKLAEKLQKEDLLEKIDKLKEQSKQESRTLERILELTKQFYVEKKSAQIMEKLEELSEEQLDLSTEEINSAEEQEKLNQKFDSLQKDFKELRKQNEALKNPMDLFDSEPDEKLIKMDMDDAKESLEKSENQDGKEQENSEKKGKEQQRKASNRMKELSKQMESGLLEMEMQGMEENMKDLQQILKNLLLFSMEQEALMLSFEDVSAKNADFPDKLKKQIKLKEHFEHVDDSLYALSIRMVKLSSKIQEDLSDAHYNLDKSLENIAENRIQQGMSNQQYTMTAANNLADLLSDMLQSMQNQKPGSGQGKGKEGELSLPDVIKKQQGMMKKMKEGMDAQKGQGKRGKEEMSGEQYQMYQEQKMIKDQMKELLDREGQGSKGGKAVLDQMEQLEKILLEKGITEESLNRMKQLEHELLELENATLKRNKDTKREAETYSGENRYRKIQDLDQQEQKEKEDELLKRKRLEMLPDYKKRVKEYFELDKP